jgi:uncharacterized protein (DUF302 family)
LAVGNVNYGLSQSYNVTQLLQFEREKDFKQNVSIFEVCNPQQAANNVNRTLMISNLLPSRIVIYEEDTQATVIPTIKPTHLIKSLSIQGDIIESIAKQVERI